MKKILLISIAILTIANSCQKIIDIELDEADKRTSIDAIIKNGQNNVEVTVTKSGNFFGNNTTPGLTDATVVLNDGTTNHTLTNMGGGKYELPNYLAVENQTYSMKVTQGGETFEASTFMPSLVKLDTIVTEYTPASTFNEAGYLITIKFQDPPSVSNYYRIEVDVDGVQNGQIDDLLLLADDLTNGTLIKFPLYGVGVANLGETVTVRLISLSEQSFTYYQGIKEVFSGNVAAPANPKNNFNNNALGNFSAFAIDSMTVVVQ